MSTRRKTAVRSFRLPEELTRELEEEAALQETTLNSLVCSVLTKYVKYDRHMSRLHYIPLPKKVVEMLVEAAGEEFLRRVAYSFGRETLRNEVDVWPQPTGFVELLEFFALRMKYAGIGNVYVNRRGEQYTIVLRHTLGAKFSKAWGWFFKGFMDSFYEDVDPAYTYSDDQLTITLKEPTVRAKSRGGLDPS